MNARWWIALLLMLSSWPAGAMEHYSNVAQDQNGRAIVGATVTVYQTGATTPAVIYSDNGLTAKSNPFTTAIDGIYDFYADNGLYDITISKLGYTSIYWDANKTKQLALFDPQHFIVPFGPSLPQTPDIGSWFVLTGDNGLCGEQSGADATPCRWDGTVWNPVGGGSGGGGGSAQGLGPNFNLDGGNTITGLTEAKKLELRDPGGTNGANMYWHSSGKWVIRGVKNNIEGDIDIDVPIDTGNQWCLRDAADFQVFCVNPSASFPINQYTFGANYRPRKSIWFGADSLYGDGTNCPADPTAVTINSGPKVPTFICLDDDGSTLYGAVKMPDAWDALTVTFQHVYLQTAANTGALNGDIACQVRGNGEAPSSTWGTEVPINDAAVTGSNNNDMTTSGAVTCTGTPQAGDMLYFRYQLAAAGTTTTIGSLHHLGFLMQYSVTSWSD